jgi:hypothetical protein
LKNNNNLKFSLSTVNDGCIHYGDIVLLKCDGTDEKKQEYIAKPARKDCYIANNCVGLDQEASIKASGVSNFVVNSTTALVIRR